MSPNHRAIVPGCWGRAVLVPLTRALKEGRSSPHRSRQLDGAMPGLGNQAWPGSVASTLLHAQSRPPHPLRLAPADPSVHTLGCSSPSSTFQFGLCLLKAAFLLPCHGTALPEGKSSPWDTAWLRLAKGVSCGPLRADGTTASNNSLLPSPQEGWYWPPKCSALSARPPRALQAALSVSPLQHCSTKYPNAEHEQGAQQVREDFPLSARLAEHPQTASRMEKGAAQGQRGCAASSDVPLVRGWTLVKQIPPSSSSAPAATLLPGGFYQGQSGYTQASHGSLVQACQLLPRADPAPLSHSLPKAPQRLQPPLPPHRSTGRS